MATVFRVASPLLRLVVEPAGASVLCVGGMRSGAGADHDVTQHIRYRGARQSPVPQSPSAASPCRLLAVSGAALTSSSAPVAPSVFVPHTQHATVALRGRRVHAGRSRQRRTTLAP